MSRFTVKWVVNCNGVVRHRIFDADQISYAADERPPDRPANSEKLGIYGVPSCGLVVIGNPHVGADSMAFSCGVVYVMNEAGKTVATYRLEHGLNPIACSEVMPTLQTQPDELQRSGGSGGSDGWQGPR